MTTYTQVRDALKNTIAQISTAGGYNRTLSSSNFKNNYASVVQNVSAPSDYPKLFLAIGDVEPKTAVARRREVTAVFWLTAVVLESSSSLNGGITTPASTQIEAIAEDVEKRLQEDYGLGGLVISTDINSVSMDSGFSHPEGVALFEIVVKWHKQY